MRQNTFERFRGLWWGGIVAGEIANRDRDLDVAVAQPDWSIKRVQLARILLDTPRVEADNSALISAIRSTLYEQNDRLNPTEKKSQQLDFSYELLTLLPLMILSGDDPSTFSKIINSCLVDSTSEANRETIEAISIWNYLLTLVWQGRFKPYPDILNFRAVSSLNETQLLEQLELVTQAINNGTGIHQLAQDLGAIGSMTQKAISLSWYCFATTPNNFQLSVARTLHLRPNLVPLTTALTATLSGAYNGLVGIPWRGQKTCQNPFSLSEEQLVLELFNNWLGNYANDYQNSTIYKLSAVATPKIIQPRKVLKIISQPPN